MLVMDEEANKIGHQTGLFEAIDFNLSDSG
jgi:hypothetical protein